MWGKVNEINDDYGDYTPRNNQAALQKQFIVFEERDATKREDKIHSIPTL